MSGELDDDTRDRVIDGDIDRQQTAERVAFLGGEIDRPQEVMIQQRGGNFDRAELRRIRTFSGSRSEGDGGDAGGARQADLAGRAGRQTICGGWIHREAGRQRDDGLLQIRRRDAFRGFVLGKMQVDLQTGRRGRCAGFGLYGQRRVKLRRFAAGEPDGVAPMSSDSAVVGAVNLPGAAAESALTVAMSGPAQEVGSVRKGLGATSLRQPKMSSP